jgi:SulP family sulfate permease
VRWKGKKALPLFRQPDGMKHLFAKRPRSATSLLGNETYGMRLRREFAFTDLLPSVPTALLSWFLTIIFSVSLAALIFRGPLAPWLSVGIGMSLFTAAIVGLVTTFTSSVPAAIAIPSDRTAPMLAILTGTLAASFPAASVGPQMIQTCLAAMILTTFLTGMMLALLGHYRLGRLVRFLPYPVVGGFMAGAGWLLVKGALTVLTGLEVTARDLDLLVQPGMVLKWAPSVAMAIILVVATRRVRHFLVIPCIVAGAVILFYVLAAWQHVSLSQLRAIGWLPGPFPEKISWHPVSFDLVFQADWERIFHQSDTVATILLVSATSVLMICSALELAANMEVDADRELETAGIANLAATLGGGLVGFHSLSVSSLVLRIGPRSRWVGLLTALGAGATLLIKPDMVSYLPIPVLGGLLFYLGLNFLTEWLFDAYRRMPRSDYAIIVLILIVVAWAGYIVGVGVGLLLAVALFVLRYSRIDVVRLELSGHQLHSNVDRSAEEQEILRPMRPSILVLKLQGFMFFGTAHGLLHRVRVRAHDASQVPLKYLFMDFRHVTGIDSSTLLSFSKLLQVSKQLGFHVVCTSVPRVVLRSLKRDPALLIEDGLLVQTDIDHAMEWCESQVLAIYRSRPTQPPLGLEELLQRALGKHRDVVRQIVHYFVQEKVASGRVLAVQGEQTRDLFLIQQGQISAQLSTAHGPAVRLRTMGAGSIVGEIGLYLNMPRTASLIVDADSVIWRLSPEALQKMEADDPKAAAALHEFLARMVATRLVQANELLETALH